MSDPLKDVLESGSRIYLECRIEDLERRVAEMEARGGAVGGAGVGPVEAALRTHLSDAEEQVELARTANVLLRKDKEALEKEVAALKLENTELKVDLNTLHEEHRGTLDIYRDVLERMEEWRDRYGRERKRALEIYDSLKQLTQIWAAAGESMARPVEDVRGILRLFGPLWLAGST